MPGRSCWLAITPSRRCDNFLYGFKGAPSARQPTGGDSLRELDAGNALGMPRTSIDAWRTWTMEAEGICGTVGGGPCPLPLRWTAPGAGGPPRVRTPAPVHSRATRRYALMAIEPSRAISGRKRARLADAAEKIPGRRPGPRPSLRDGCSPGHPLARPGKALRPNPRGAQGLATLGPTGTPLPAPENRAPPAGCPTEGMTFPTHYENALTVLPEQQRRG